MLNAATVNNQGTITVFLLMDGVGKQTYPVLELLNGSWDFPGRPDWFPDPNATNLPLADIPHWSYS